MCLLPADRQFLDRALALAEQAAAFASPNPTVGCVLARDGEVLGDGAHRYAERDHAEIVALKAASAAGRDLRGATAYVTLEPCSHHGRTGPCANALIAAGISRCVVLTIDPNPLVRGQGVAKLQTAGITVHVLDPQSAPAQRARRLNDAFAFSIQHGRPFVTLKAAVSRDGKLAPAPRRRVQHQPFWLTGQAAREDVQRLRHASDAIVTGIGTVLADNPSLTDRTGLTRRRPLLRVVLDASLRTPPDSALVQSADQDLLILTSDEAPHGNEKQLRAKGADVIRLASQNQRLDLDLVMGTLASLSLRSVLVEAGSRLNAALLARDLVDRVVLYTAPVDLGPDALPFAEGGPSPELLAAQLSQQHRTAFPNGDADDLRLSGYLHDPWTGI